MGFGEEEEGPSESIAHLNEYFNTQVIRWPRYTLLLKKCPNFWTLALIIGPLAEPDEDPGPKVAQHTQLDAPKWNFGCSLCCIQLSAGPDA